MKENLTLLSSFIVIMVILFIINTIFSGCSGASGNSSVPPFQASLNSPVIEEPGTFKVTITISGKEGSKNADKVVPYLYGSSNKLRVTIEGDGMDPNTKEVAITGPGMYSLSFTSIPVGQKLASISILADGNLLAQRDYPFYMVSGGTASPPNPFSMGLIINESGDCHPQVIDIPLNTILYFQNLDPNNNRSVKFIHNETETTIGPIDAAFKPLPNATISGQLYGLSYTFDSTGTYTYVNGFGTHNPGASRILVYGSPSISTYTVSGMNFYITGSNFGTDRNMVKGDVIFNSTTFADTITTWVDNAIYGTTSLLPTYSVKVMVREVYSNTIVIYGP